jgi:hypothetical protein
MNRPDHSALAQNLTSARTALLAGNLVELANLSGKLEETAETMLPKSLKEARLIRQMAEENSVLLAAALKGVRAARQRLRDLSEQGRFSTYESNGNRYQPGVSIQAPARRL